LKMWEALGVVGLADYAGPRPLRRGEKDGFLFRQKVLERREPPGRRQSGNIEGFVDRHRNPEQQPPLASGKRDIGGSGRLARTLEVAGDDRIEALIQSFNLRDGVFKVLPL